MQKLSFCWNSRRWLIGAIDPRTCPWLDHEGQNYCIGDQRCGYFEEREGPMWVWERVWALQFMALREKCQVHEQYGAKPAPRVTPGVDHGAEGIVLLEYHDRSLVWRPGCYTFAGQGRPSTYGGSHVEVLAPHVGWGLMGKKVTHGRFSRKALVEKAGQIRDLMEIPEQVPFEAVLGNLDKKKTIFLRDVEQG